MKKMLALTATIMLTGTLAFAAADTSESLAQTPKAPVLARQKLNMDAAYESAGVTQTQKDKLKELETKIREAREAKEMEKFKTLTQERRDVLTTEQQQKVREYMRQQMQPAVKAMPSDAATSPSAM
ncbi:MAG: hypothetical protein WCK47_10710 [bacterium]|nr:hypothetical protein [Candidatus Sumerlaeota bacterium]